MKTWKIFTAIGVFIAIICKAFKLGSDKEKLNRLKESKKINKQAKKDYEKAISGDSSDARNRLHKKKRNRNK